MKRFVFSLVLISGLCFNKPSYSVDDSCGKRVFDKIVAVIPVLELIGDGLTLCCGAIFGNMDLKILGLLGVSGDVTGLGHITLKKGVCKKLAKALGVVALSAKTVRLVCWFVIMAFAVDAHFTVRTFNPFGDIVTMLLGIGAGLFTVSEIAFLKSWFQKVEHEHDE